MNDAALCSVSPHLRVGDERHPVGTLQDELAGRGVEHLTGTVKILSRKLIALVSPRRHHHGAQDEGQHVEEQRAVVLRLERHEPPRLSSLVEVMEDFRFVVLPLSAGP